MRERWPLEQREISVAALTVAACAIMAWAGGIIAPASTYVNHTSEPSDTEHEEGVATEDSSEQSGSTVDLVGMVMQDDRAKSGFVLITSYGAAFALEFNDDVSSTYDPVSSLEWHVVGEVNGETDVDTELPVVAASTLRPFNAVVYERVEVPVIVEVEREPQIVAGQPEPVHSTAQETPATTVAGTIDPYVMAIGGETTGTGIRTAANELVEVDLSAVLDTYRSTNNRDFVNWIATGVLEEREYPTRGVVPTLRVLQLKAGGN